MGLLSGVVVEIWWGYCLGLSCGYREGCGRVFVELSWGYCGVIVGLIWFYREVQALQFPHSMGTKSAAGSRNLHKLALAL